MARFEPHSHTHYSNLRLVDCINKPKELINYAISLGLSGIAITDHEALCGAPEINLYQQEIQKEHPDFKIAIGNEIYLTYNRQPKQKYYHFILIAKDKTGFRMLRELSSVSHMHSFEDRKMERVPTLKTELAEKIAKYGKGHLIATTACLGGELSTLTWSLVQAEDAGQDVFPIKQDIHDFITFCLRLFGDDFYIECAPGRSEEQIRTNQRLQTIAKAYNVKMVIGTDAHFLRKEDRYVHKSYLNSKEGDREVDDFYQYSYLQTAEEIIENLKPSNLNYEELVCNSEEIYNKIENYSIQHKQQIPRVEVTDYPKSTAYWSVNNDRADEMNNYPTVKALFTSDDKQERYWINQCFEALEEQIGPWYENLDYVARLEEEADIKKTISEKLETNMFSYPITLQHYINMIWECGSMIGAGRGSSCSGLNHELLGVTQLDPIKWDLPFFRYLNKERVELGDIDIDLCPSKRPLILSKIKEERKQHFIDGLDEASRDNLGCTLIATFGTESTKSTILTACRGYRSEDCPSGIDIDEAQYISSLVPQERGFLWTLDDLVYGNEAKGRAPSKMFINEINKFPGLIDIMFGIQGLIKQKGSHASGVILFDEDPYEFGAFMKTPSGDVITQFDLHMCESMGMTKFDFLVTDVQDKLVKTIDLLQKAGEIDPTLSLKEVYNEMLHPGVINIEDDELWDALRDGEVLNVFQFDSDVGAQAAKKIQPRNMNELADANGLMRLMTAEKGEETPMEKYIRFKNDISLWYQEMDDFGLTKEEQGYLEPYFKPSYGVPPSQEQLMRMLMDPNICGFSLGEANAARKIVGKKQMNKIPELHQKVLDTATSSKLGQYVWKYGVGPQMGYSFSIIHALAYSFIGYQTLFMAKHFNPIYWDTACLIVNSGAIDEEEGGSTDYGKLAKAIGDIREANIKISLVDINKSDYGFSPDIENNQILFGMKALLNVGDEVIAKTIENRPYTSIKDYYNKVKPNKQAMISLIKGGAFDNFMDRRLAMAWFIWETCDRKTNLTMQNMPTLMKYNIIPQDDEKLVTGMKVYEFNRYLKAMCKHGNDYKLDVRALNFLVSMGWEDILENEYIVKNKTWDKIYQAEMDVFRNWMADNKTEILKYLNEVIFKEDWEKYATGSVSKWEMEVLCFYYHEHELANLNMSKYGISNFFDLPKDPAVDRTFTAKNGAQVNIFKLSKICGTCIAKNKARHTVTLLTKDGVIEVKFRKEYFSMFDKQISERQADGKKKVMEKSWFQRGSMIMVQGFRSDDMFITKKYSSTPGHQLYKILEIDKDGDIILQDQRYQGGIAEDVDE